MKKAKTTFGAAKLCKCRHFCNTEFVECRVKTYKRYSFLKPLILIARDQSNKIITKIIVKIVMTTLIITIIIIIIIIISLLFL